MVTDTLQEIQKHEAKLAELKAEFEAQRIADLKTLPAKYGYDSLDAFIKGIKEVHAMKGRGRPPGKAKVVKAPKAAAPKKAGKRTRAVITPEMKQQVKTLVEGGKTGAEIAKTLGISLPSVQNIKKELGLVKARSAAPAAS